jgi:hypothetical protein
MFSGRVAGSDARDRGVRVAGWLAERGVTRLELAWADGARGELAARDTDLPGEITAAGDGARLTCAELGVVFEIDAAGITWRTDREEIAEELRLLHQA